MNSFLRSVGAVGAYTVCLSAVFAFFPEWFAAEWVSRDTMYLGKVLMCSVGAALGVLIYCTSARQPTSRG